jgi:two-component system response regulator HydG
MLLCEGDLLPTELLVPAGDEPGRADAPQSLAAVERVHILAVLERCQQDRDQAASLLGISRSTLRRKLIEYGLWTPRATDSK